MTKNWYKDETYIIDGETRQALLGAGYAILALDAAAHGERSNEIDYQHVNSSYGPALPIDYTWGTRTAPFLMLMGRKDEMGDPAKVEASYHKCIESPNTKLIWYDRDHKLGGIYVPDALAWVKEHL